MSDTELHALAAALLTLQHVLEFGERGVEPMGAPNGGQQPGAA